MVTIKDIEDRLAAATPGPWRRSLRPGTYRIVRTEHPAPMIAEAWCGPTADFIASAPTDIRLLLDVAKAASRIGDLGYHYDLANALDALEAS